MNPSIEQLLNVQRVDKEIRFLAEAKRLRPEELSDERKKLAISNSMVEAVVEAIKQGRLEIEKGAHGIKNEDAMPTLHAVQADQLQCPPTRDNDPSPLSPK